MVFKPQLTPEPMGFRRMVALMVSCYHSSTRGIDGAVCSQHVSLLWPTAPFGAQRADCGAHFAESQDHPLATPLQSHLWCQIEGGPEAESI